MLRETSHSEPVSALILKRCTGICNFQVRPGAQAEARGYPDCVNLFMMFTIFKILNIKSFNQRKQSYETTNAHTAHWGYFCSIFGLN